MKRDNLSIISAILVATIALLAFILSFDAIQQLAIATGTNQYLAWIVPVIVDGAMVVFSVARLRAVLAGERTWWVWGLIVAFTALSVLFNIAHAHVGWLAWIIAALAPLALFFAFETLMSQVQGNVQAGVNALAKHWRGRAISLLALAKHWRECAKTAQSNAKQMQDDYAALLSRADNLQAQVGDLKAVKSEHTQLQKEFVALHTKFEDLQDVDKAWKHMNPTAQAAAMYNVGKFATLEEAAAGLNVGGSTVSRLAKSLNGAQ
jgi:hypothetical protein